MTWRGLLGFMWNRFRQYRRHKPAVDQWDAQGKLVKRLAEDSKHGAEEFIVEVLSRLGVNNGS